MTVRCECGWEGDDTKLIQLIRNQKERYCCPNCGCVFRKWPEKK